VIGKLKTGTSKFVLKKLLELLLTLFVVTVISFLLMRLSPVDPATALARRTFVIDDATRIAEFQEQMGLNKPLYVQYADWVSDAVRLEFGSSYVSGNDVFEQVMKSISITASIVFLSAGIQAVGILILGCLCYWKRNKITGHILNFLCIAGISIPAFYFASSFIDIFAVKFRFISVAGNVGIMRFLPAALCISISGIAFYSQLLATGIESAMREDSAFYARCRGLSEKRILLFHALPQAITKLLPNFMQMLGLCMAGATIVERIFSLPGLGYLIIDSVLYRDSPMIHATILFLAFSLAIFNIISDVLQRAIQGKSEKEGGAV